MKDILLVSLLLTFTAYLGAQNIQDDFEGGGNVSTWYGDNCGMIEPYANPFRNAQNTSGNVLLYQDSGGTYANVRFDVGRNLNMQSEHTFHLMLYVPSNGITGNQNHQVSLKLQDNRLQQPWTTQTEIIQPIQLDKWQQVEFNFRDGNFKNLDAASQDPIDRSDLNRVVIQLNGEGNSDHVIAYLDNLLVDGKRDTTNTSNNSPYDRLVWSDEFDGNGPIDMRKWYHQTLLPNGQSWYNGEVQHYTNRTDNSYLANGELHIKAKKERFTDQGVSKDYTSARLNSKYAFTYGRVEVKAKLPLTSGTWPAIWMLGKNIQEPGAFFTDQYGSVSWPACGEIDIMEHWGTNPNFVQSAMHTPSSHGGTINKGGKSFNDVKNEYHIYTVDWYRNKMVFSYDDEVVYVYEPSELNASTWPFTEDQYILLNVAIEPGIVANFTEEEMIIDYVRVYQETPASQDAISNKGFHLNVYPNPASGSLFIDFGIEISHATLEILSLSGTLIQQQDALGTAQAQFDVSELATGTYVLRFKHSMGVESQLIRID